MPRVPTFTASTPDPLAEEEEELATPTLGSTTPAATTPAPTGGRVPTPAFTATSPTPEAETVGPSANTLTQAALGNTAPVGRAATVTPTAGTTPMASMQPAVGGSAPLPQFLNSTMGNLVAPNKIVARNWMRLDPSSQAFFRSAYEAQGYDPQYIDWIVQRGLPGMAGTRVGQRGRILS